MQKLDKKEMALGILSTIMIGTVAYFSIRVYVYSLFKHLRFPIDIRMLIGLLVFVPSIVATLGMIFRKAWSLPLSAIVSLLSLTSILMLLYDEQLTLYAKIPFIIFVVFIILLLFGIFFNSRLKNYFNFPSDLQGVKKYISQYKVPLSISVIILVALQIVCVKRYLYFQQYPWPPPEVVNSQIYKKWPFFVQGDLPNSDIEQILIIINSIYNIDKRIISISLENDIVTVTTGYIKAPAWGEGFEIRLKRKGSIWVVFEQSEWISKNSTEPDISAYAKGHGIFAKAPWAAVQMLARPLNSSLARK